MERARGLLGSEPTRALGLAQTILAAVPGQAEARLISAVALRRSGDAHGALSLSAPLAAERPNAWGPHFEAGAALAMLGRTQPAVAALTRATQLNPNAGLAWHGLAGQLSILGEEAGAERAAGRQVPGSIHDPDLREAVRALFDTGANAAVERLQRFSIHLDDPVAVNLVGDIGLSMGRHEDVETLLAAGVDAAPRLLPLRRTYAVALQHQNKIAPALVQAERLLLQEPGAHDFLCLKAALLVDAADYEQAVELYAAVLKARPDQPRLWLSYGHALKIVGRQADSAAAYRRSIALQPGLGEAYWSLANLKVVPFDQGELASMSKVLDRDDVSPQDRAALHFALGKALEDLGRFGAAFAHCQQGAALRRAGAPHDAQAHHNYVQRAIATFTPAFFAERTGVGCPAQGPIFVVGLPRSGSTLIEQMLSSHSSVEGVSELPDLMILARRLARISQTGAGAPYPTSLGSLGAPAFAAAGEAYIERTRLRRKLDRAYLIDKFPSNFLHTGLIHLILPNARIIDVRRRPMACCLSLFKHHFAEGQNYSYDLGDLGRYYADYVALMTHFDAVLPGRVHHVQYEAVVQDAECEIRRLLDYCGLEFEAGCLRFYESRRPVRTASSEQVRRPIFSHGLDHWRHFEPWLEPLKAALGPALARSEPG